jgi:hypothetical protein
MYGGQKKNAALEQTVGRIDKHSSMPITREPIFNYLCADNRSCRLLASSQEEGSRVNVLFR